MSWTITMEDYASGLVRAGARAEFDAWLGRTGIGKMLCFELTLPSDEGAAFTLRCYRSLRYREQYTRRIVRDEPLPASVLRYLAVRERELE